MKQLVVITGCSSGGKSTLIAELKTRGYWTVPEPGRIIVKEALASGSDLTPWQRPIDFCAAIIQRGIADYQEKQALCASQESQYCFFDRCFLDAVCYFQTLTRPDAHQYNHLVSSMRFCPLVFMVPPWPDIYCQDEERKHSLTEAMVEHERLMAFYPQYGYQVVEVPKASVAERIDFILVKLKTTEKKHEK